MYMKVFPHGQGNGHAPTHYLVRQDYHGRDENPPQVLRGNVETTRQLIDSLETKWRFTAGVLSWHPDDKVTEEQEEKIMDDFEAVAFAGLEADQRNILWVRHSHAGHHELHFVIPRMELHSGKAFNPCPPGWQKHFDVFRDLHNIREQWARPDDPARARLFTPEQADLNRARLLRWGKQLKQDERANARQGAKEAINEYIRTGIEQGQITNRQEIVKALQDAGLKINRAGKDYITVQDPYSGEKLRLKGQIYAEHWKYTGIPHREDEAEDGRKQADRRADDARAVQRLEQELAGIIKKRFEYNRKRYPPRAYDLGRELFQTLPDGAPILEYQHGTDGASSSDGNHHGRYWDDDLLSVSTQEPTGRNRSADGEVQQFEKSNEPMGSKDMGAGIIQSREWTIHNTPQGHEHRQRTMGNEQQRRHTLNYKEQIGVNHDGNRTSLNQDPHQDGAGTDHHTGQAHRNFTSPQERPVIPQGATSPYAETNQRTDQAIAKFEQCLRELDALVGKIEQYIAQKLEKEKKAEEKQIQYTRLRM